MTALSPHNHSGQRLPTTKARDQRVRRASLTKAGIAKLAETTRLWETAQDRFERAFGVEEACNLRAALSVIASDGFVVAFEQPSR